MMRNGMRVFRGIRFVGYTPLIGKILRDEALKKSEHFQQLSCRAGGQFDKKFHTPAQKAKMARGERIR